MRCIVKSWYCPVCFREEFIIQPKNKHFLKGKLCDGKWVCYEWGRRMKPFEVKQGGVK